MAEPTTHRPFAGLKTSKQIKSFRCKCCTVKQIHSGIYVGLTKQQCSDEYSCNDLFEKLSEYEVNQSFNTQPLPAVLAPATQSDLRSNRFELLLIREIRGLQYPQAVETAFGDLFLK